MILGIALLASLATFLGGALALKLKDKLHLVLGFSAGAIIAVAFFDLIPESLELGLGHFEAGTLITFTAIGFFLYTILDRFILTTRTLMETRVCTPMPARPLVVLLEQAAFRRTAS